MTPRLVFLARHGETEWNAIGKLQGHTDVPLNEAGRAQAGALGEALASEGIASVTTSDLSRARATGAIVAERLSLAPPRVDADLRERRFGIFEGLTREECITQHPEAWAAWLSASASPAGGELAEHVVERMTRALTRVVEHAHNGPALVVSHGGVMRLWLLALLGAPVPPIGNGTVYLLEHDGVRFFAGAWEP
ncbi:MAG: histidine phosphatase family protein [Polyangiaceae bacterium]